MKTENGRVKEHPEEVLDMLEDMGLSLDVVVPNQIVMRSPPSGPSAEEHLRDNIVIDTEVKANMLQWDFQRRLQNMATHSAEFDSGRKRTTDIFGLVESWASEPTQTVRGIRTKVMREKKLSL